MRLACLAAVVGLAAAAGPTQTPSEVFISFFGEPFVHEPSGLEVNPGPQEATVTVRNTKIGFRLQLPASDWVFRTDRLPLEASDTEYFVSVTASKGRRPERQQLMRTLKRLKKQPDLAIGLPSLEQVEGRPLLRYYSHSLSGGRRSSSSRVEWTYGTCVSGADTMYELHVIRREAREREPVDPDPRILSMVRSLEAEAP